MPGRAPDVHQAPTVSGPAAPRPAGPAYPGGANGPVAPRAPLPPPAPSAPGGWFAQDRPPPPMPGGVTWAHAATAPGRPAAGAPAGPGGPHGTSGGAPGGAPGGDGPRYAPGYAPGQVFAGPPPPERGTSTRLLVMVTAVVVVLAAAVTIVSLHPWDDGGPAAPAAAASPDGSSPAAPDPGGAGGDGPAPGATRETTPGDARSPAPSSPPAISPPPGASAPAGPDAQARAVDGLLARSAGQRGTVQAAVGEVSRCGDLVTARQQLLRAADDRAALVRDLAALPLDALPDAVQAIDRLRTAWAESEAADRAYAQWALSSQTSCPGDPASYEAGNAASERATAAKQAFADLWNPIAARHGLTARTAGEI